jgi:catechol 2,3-dioxygenase-like lactoylglutathione lyase family enzyme
MADLTRVRCVLAVRELAASVELYTRVLGMALDFTAPGWAFLSRGSFRLMLGECSDAIPAHELGDHRVESPLAVPRTLA